MKKGLLRMWALACALALGVACAAMLTACGDDEKGETYSYSKSSVESDKTTSEIVDAMSGAMTGFDAMFSGSTLEVTDSKVIWSMKDVKNEMSYTKDGDKLILAGEYADSIKDAFKDLATGMTVEISMYGIKTETGFDIVAEEKISGSYIGTETLSIRMRFVKA